MQNTMFLHLMTYLSMLFTHMEVIRIKIGKARRQARVVLSEDEVIDDDSSKQGRKLSSAEKASDEVSTAGAKKGTATEEVPIWDEEEKEKAMAEAKVWDFNQNIEPMDAEHGSGKQKSPKKSPEKSPEKMKSAEKMEEDDVAKETGAKRKKSIPRKSTRKRQKMEEDAEKEELKGFLDIIPREEVPIEYSEDDGSSKNYKILSEMLEDFDRQDVEELYRLVKERYSASRPEEGYLI
ncbi:hypothetical protein Tco_1040705 [Tanacetum coccineum]